MPVTVLPEPAGRAVPDGRAMIRLYRNKMPDNQRERNVPVGSGGSWCREWGEVRAVRADLAAGQVRAEKGNASF